jgi:type III pantothenate kinase
MHLLIDIGNSRLKWATATAGTIARRGAVAHADVAIDDVLAREWAGLRDVRSVHVASVAPLAFDTDVERSVHDVFGVEAAFLRSPAAALGIRNAYSEPQRLGIDRFLGLAAIHASAPRPQVLIGVGTAMTLDALDADGTHLGGWILPSPALMRESVLARTARVGVSEGSLVDFADNTADGLYSGTLYDASGAVARFAANAAREFGAWPAIVLTGGGADEIAPLLPGAERRSDLVVEGLALWAHAAESPDFARDAR